MTVSNELGLFNYDNTKWDDLTQIVGKPEHGKIAQNIARKSITVVKDNGQLPLKPEKIDRLSHIILSTDDGAKDRLEAFSRDIRFTHKNVNEIFINEAVSTLRIDEIDDFINLNKEWAKTKGLIITDPEKEKEMLWKNHKNGIEKIFLAYKEKKLISGLRIGVFNKIAYTNFVINSYKDPTNLGCTLLTWNALEWAKNNDYHIFDFSGGPLDGVDSLLAYKKKMGWKTIHPI